MSVNVTGAEGRPRDLPYAAPSPLFLRDEELTRGIELLEAAYGALLGRPDRVLGGLGLGRNHGRILYCIGRQPGIAMVELQDRVQLTKQTVSRLLKELVGKGLIRRAADRRDRRRRLLELTAYRARAGRAAQRAPAPAAGERLPRRRRRGGRRLPQGAARPARRACPPAEATRQVR